jgi:hypothetical protein
MKISNLKCNLLPQENNRGLKAIIETLFRFIYFAALAMAAELSTGVLALMYVNKQKTSVSMLVLGMETKFHKKAKSLIRIYLKTHQCPHYNIQSNPPQKISLYPWPKPICDTLNPSAFINDCNCRNN